MVEGYGELMEIIKTVGCRGLLLGNCALDEDKLNQLSNGCDANGVVVSIIDIIVMQFLLYTH